MDLWTSGAAIRRQSDYLPHIYGNKSSHCHLEKGCAFAFSCACAFDRDCHLERLPILYRFRHGQERVF